MLLPCSSKRFLPRQTVLQELLQHGCFPWVAVLINCSSVSPFHVSFLQRAVLQECIVTWVLPGACSSVGSPRYIHGYIHVLWCKTSMGCMWIPPPPLTTMGCRDQLASPRSSPLAAREPLLQHLEHFLTLLCRAVSLNYSHFSLSVEWICHLLTETTHAAPLTTISLLGKLNTLR